MFNYFCDITLLYMGILPTEDVVFAFLEIFLFYSGIKPNDWAYIWIILPWSIKNALFLSKVVLFPRFTFKGNMRRCHIFCCSFVCFYFLDFSLFFLIKSIRGKATVFWVISMTFILWTVWILFWIVLFSLVPRKSEPNLWFLFCIEQNFQCTFLGLTSTLASFSFSILTRRNMDLESDHLGSNPNPYCSSILELWANSLASLSFSFSSITNEDCNNRLLRKVVMRNKQDNACGILTLSDI